MKIIWLGQGGFLFETKGQRLLIDPFLSNIVEERQGLKRLVEPPLALDELRPDYIFITHNHLDHFDPIALPEIHHQYPKALIGGPESVMLKAKEFNFDTSVLVRADKSESLHFGVFKITATLAYHSDPYTVGILIKVGGKTIYFSSDTLFNETLAADVRSLAGSEIDVVIICINGKLGNMNWQEALKVVDQLQPSLAIPMHYGMFAENTVDPSQFLEGCKEINVQPLELLHGIQVEI
jgi:L-ascorbate metabolism protein UlaG (beta-lactamase superfamily)